jgi:hypothetical protein
MEAKDLIFKSLEQSQGYLTKALEGLTEDEAAGWQPPRRVISQALHFSICAAQSHPCVWHIPCSEQSTITDSALQDSDSITSYNCGMEEVVLQKHLLLATSMTRALSESNISPGPVFGWHVNLAGNLRV